VLDIIAPANGLAAMSSITNTAIAGVIINFRFEISSMLKYPLGLALPPSANQNGEKSLIFCLAITEKISTKIWSPSCVATVNMSMVPSITFTRVWFLLTEFINLQTCFYNVSITNIENIYWLLNSFRKIEQYSN
jgi:hypothetical protein